MGWTKKGRIERCEAENGAGNCEEYGFIAYPKCKPGFTNFGCCICRPPKPNCKELGFINQWDLSCEKRASRGECISAANPNQDIKINTTLPYMSIA
jgi:hypothetical protein